MPKNNDTTVNPPKHLIEEPKPKGDYGISRLNATKHGILSRYTVLPWENKKEYERLLNTLVHEHNPHGPTEMHLVEELAGIIWRKHRLRLAEAGCYGGPDPMMLNVVTPQYKSDNYLQFMPSALPSKVYDDFFKHLTTTKFSQENTVSDALTKIQMAIDTIIDNEEASEEEIMSILDPHTVQSWAMLMKYVSKGKNYIENLVIFLQENMTPTYEMLLENLSGGDVSEMVTRASSVNTTDLDKLTRYETTLDRKFERTLGMLLKLKDIRQRTRQINL